MQDYKKPMIIGASIAGLGNSFILLYSSYHWIICQKLSPIKSIQAIKKISFPQNL